MKRTAFASLIGVSHQMVSKYVQDGVVLLDANGLVEVDASLQRLQGRLRPERLHRALAARQAIEGAPPAPQPQSPKLQRDVIERDLKLVQLGRELGDLVLAESVDDAGRRAVLALRDSFAVTRRESAQRLSATFGIAPDRTAALAAALLQEFEAAMSAFAREMQREAVNALPPALTAAPETATRAPTNALL